MNKLNQIGERRGIPLMNTPFLINTMILIIVHQSSHKPQKISLSFQ